MRTLLLTFTILLTACAHRGVEGIELTLAPQLREAFSARGMLLSAMWDVPGAPAMRLAIIEKDPEGDDYGPQLVALEGMRILHESARLMDATFVYPTFFQFADRTLVLADHGSEDAYAVLVWSIENGRVRDLGEHPIALPEEGGIGFTRGAAPRARVSLRGGRYVIGIPGPVLQDPRAQNERVIAREGETLVFEESAAGLQMSTR